MDDYLQIYCGSIITHDLGYVPKLLEGNQMSIYNPTNVTCDCGRKFTIGIAEGVNIGRAPDARQAILDGTFHRATCPSCNTPLVVEKEFFYSDFERNTFFKINPRKNRHQWQEASRELDVDVHKLPDEFSDQSTRQIRVVFGLGELREKLIAQDTEIDDRIVEILKVLIVYEHPFLLRRSRLRLQLDSVTLSSICFVALFDHNEEAFEISIPRTICNDLIERREELQSWIGRHHKNNIFALKQDYWVNMWRWSPQPSALNSLRLYSDLARSGKKIDTSSQEFKNMLLRLPRGNSLPSWAKRALAELQTYAKKHHLAKLEDKLFELRFDISLDDDWSANNHYDDIDILWTLLRDLPDTNVEGNTYIQSLQLVSGSGGRYSPQDREISIGENLLINEEWFEDVVRHEVGHAVQEQKDSKNNGLVSRWLNREFGWREFGSGNHEIDNWVGLMGGYGKLSKNDINKVRDRLRDCLGKGNEWKPPELKPVAPNHPWNSKNFGPRIAFENTGRNWYLNHSNWHRNNGVAFFVNFFYRKFAAVEVSTLQLVDKMPSRYAAMSSFEFFAELYALFYDLNDSRRQNIPRKVMVWLSKNIGVPDDLVVKPITSQIKFADVPIGQGTVRAAVFSVRTGEQKVTLKIVQQPESPFGIPYDDTVVFDPIVEGSREGKIRLWIYFKGVKVGAQDEGSVTISCQQTKKKWKIPIIATTIVKPKVATALILDRSGSMKNDAGLGNGQKRIDVLRQAASVYVDLMNSDDGIGIASFSDNGAKDLKITEAGSDPFGAGRIDAKDAIGNLTPGGSTSIGDGVVKGYDIVRGVGGYDHRALVVLTDGYENTPPYIADIGGLSRTRVFAIGVGTPDQLNPVALHALTNSTGGYLMMTGDQKVDVVRLSKYFLQVLAGVENSDIVLDPEGRLPDGKDLTHRIPFQLTDSDKYAEVILLLPQRDVVKFILETPRGRLIKPNSSLRTMDFNHVIGENVTYWRIGTPIMIESTEAPGKPWYANLSVNKEALDSMDIQDVPYSLVVKTKSNLNMRTTLIQESREPVADIKISVKFTESGSPLRGEVNITAHIEVMQKAILLPQFDEVEDGHYISEFQMSDVGSYPIYVRANGLNNRDQPFTREQLQTVSIWRGGDNEPPSGDAIIIPPIRERG